MKYRAMRRKGEPPQYIMEATDPRKQKEEHTPGWPHYDLKGNCICLCRRCMGPSGCICKYCKGIGHVNCPGAERIAQTDA